MKGYIFLMYLAVSPVISLQAEPEIVDIDDDKDTADINPESQKDDIMEINKGRSATSRNILWTLPVPYDLNNTLDINAKGVILKAFEQFRLKSCIDFKPRDSEEYYISAKKLDGCSSFIGRVIRDGQNLSIGQNCDRIAIVEHEFLHALGFFHEQSRYDRDDHVRIITENILEGRERNFRIVSRDISTTNGVDYDYISVMHYPKDFFTNGNGSTLETLDPKFQDVIGQRLEMSPSDVLELNLLYGCNSSVALHMFCGFSNETMCQMNRCSRGGISWEMVTKAEGGPSSDHTNLPGGSDERREGESHFMHVSTASGEEGDSAWLETERMSPKRDCNVQCLQFYYYHGGNESDTLNIWIREFKDEEDSVGSIRLMGQITGSTTSHWKLHHVSLNATKKFQVEFEILKGAGSSAGGFSIDDINLSELQCPHVTIQIDDFTEVLETSSFGSIIYSPRQYSAGGYAYRGAVRLARSFVGLFVQLVSGDNDDRLKWPCPYRQANLEMLDQNPNLQMQMSKQRSITTDPEKIRANGLFFWDNPRNNGTEYTDENGEEGLAGPLVGQSNFLSLEEMQFREFLKGETAVFTFSFEDINPLFEDNVLPCAATRTVTIKNPPKRENEGPCSRTLQPTTMTPLKTTDKSTLQPTTMTPSKTTDKSTLQPTTMTPSKTTDKSTLQPTTMTPSKTTDKSTLQPTTMTPSKTTDRSTLQPTTMTPSKTTDKSTLQPTTMTPSKTTDKSTLQPTTMTPSKTTDKSTLQPTTMTPSKTTDKSTLQPTTMTPSKTTDKSTLQPTTMTPSKTTDKSTLQPTTMTPSKTTDKSTLQPTTMTPSKTTDKSTLQPTTMTPSKTTDKSTLQPTTMTPSKTTDKSTLQPTTMTPSKTTDKSTLQPTTMTPSKTTDRSTLQPTTTTPLKTTDRRITTTSLPTPETTGDESILNFSPVLVASPVLTLLLALVLLLP